MEVIRAASTSTKLSQRKGILSMVLVEAAKDNDQLRKRPKLSKELIEFRDEDLEGTTQPHDDALMLSYRIRGFTVERVLIDQGSEAEVMYLDLYKGLGLKPKDLSKYDTPLVGFDEKAVIPEGQISLPVNPAGKEIVVNFIVVNAFSPYTVILRRPWMHNMGAILSTLHVKVKFHTEGGITMVRGNQ
ncbi:uncharacterized protein LOC111998496 [Quercus suber]|uniref:uncharacterized protein LOC111998496 n=1 Tax=Quercus suber TaxID=58331 RepID=UPI0032DF4634